MFCLIKRQNNRFHIVVDTATMCYALLRFFIQFLWLSHAHTQTHTHKLLSYHLAAQNSLRLRFKQKGNILENYNSNSAQQQNIQIKKKVCNKLQTQIVILSSYYIYRGVQRRHNCAFFCVKRLLIFSSFH